MKFALMAVVALAPGVIGVGLLCYSIYLRVAVISDDAFDPMRGFSVSLLWMSCIAFLLMAGTCAIFRR